MRVSDFEDVLNKCDGDSEVVIFIRTENKMIPFKNIEWVVFNEGAFNESLYLTASTFNEFKNVHFPNNLTEEEYSDLMDKKDIVLDELYDIETKLGGSLWKK